VIVIGGGVSGSYISYLLKTTRNRNSILLESSDRIGGKCKTIEIDGVEVDVGAILVPSYYKRVRKMVSVLGLTLTPSPDFVFESGETIIQKAINDYGYLSAIGGSLLYTVTAYCNSKITYYPWVAQRKFLQPVDTFLPENCMTAMSPIADYALTRFGYGRLNEVPMTALLNIIPAEFLIETALSSIPLIGSLVANSTDFLVEGYQTLVQGILNASGANVQTNAKVSTINFSGNKKILHIADGRQLTTEGDVVLCASITELDIFYPDQKHQNLFAELKSSYIANNYTVITFESTMPLPLGGNFATNVDVSSKEFMPLCFGHKNSNSIVYGAYFYCDSSEVNTCISNLQYYLSTHFQITGIVVKDISVLTNYFPRPNFKALNDDFYKKLDNLQGVGGIYFAGSYCNFEDVERCMQNVETLINDKFPIKKCCNCF